MQMDTNLLTEQRDAGSADGEAPAGERTAALPTRAETVAADSLFDEAFYARASGASGNRLDLAAHYLRTGEGAMLSPSAAFDVRFYLYAYPDVARDGGSALLHYLVHGRAEQRYPSRRALRRDADKVAASGLFDARAYASDRGRPARPGFSEIEEYLIGRNNRALVGEAFDGVFYAAAFDDVEGGGADGEASGHAMPILHYIALGRAELRPPHPAGAGAADAGRAGDVRRAVLPRWVAPPIPGAAAAGRPAPALFPPRLPPRPRPGAGFLR